jgi:hypothetical protein
MRLKLERHIVKRLHITPTWASDGPDLRSLYLKLYWLFRLKIRSFRLENRNRVFGLELGFSDSKLGFSDSRLGFRTRNSILYKIKHSSLLYYTVFAGRQRDIIVSTEAHYSKHLKGSWFLRRRCRTTMELNLNLTDHAVPVA